MLAVVKDPISLETQVNGEDDDSTLGRLYRILKIISDTSFVKI